MKDTLPAASVALESAIASAGNGRAAGGCFRSAVNHSSQAPSKISSSVPATPRSSARNRETRPTARIMPAAAGERS